MLVFKNLNAQLLDSQKTREDTFNTQKKRIPGTFDSRVGFPAFWDLAFQAPAAYVQHQDPRAGCQGITQSSSPSSLAGEVASWYRPTLPVSGQTLEIFFDFLTW